MKHKVRVTVLDKKLYPELVQGYCLNKETGVCSVFNVGDVYEFRNDVPNRHFSREGLNSLVSTTGDPEVLCGGPNRPFCAEAWDAISKYIYTGLQGGSIMNGWMEKENQMIKLIKYLKLEDWHQQLKIFNHRLSMLLKVKKDLTKLMYVHHVFMGLRQYYSYVVIRI